MIVEMLFVDVIGVIVGIFKVVFYSGDVFVWCDVVGLWVGLVSVDIGK